MWRPIETAPKDGTPIVIGRPWNGSTILAIAEWIHNRGWWAYWIGQAPMYPTHWMPIPEIPTKEDEATQEALTRGKWQ